MGYYDDLPVPPTSPPSYSTYWKDGSPDFVTIPARVNQLMTSIIEFKKASREPHSEWLTEIRILTELLTLL